MCCSSATSCAGSTAGPTVANDAYEQHYAAYFQDRWKPSSRIAVKAGIRVENIKRLHGRPRRRCSARCCRRRCRPTPNDREFHQNVAMPNFGISLDAGRWGVFRGTAQRSYEWLDLGGGDGTSHAPNVLATDIFRA